MSCRSAGSIVVLLLALTLTGACAGDGPTDPPAAKLPDVATVEAAQAKLDAALSDPALVSALAQLMPTGEFAAPTTATRLLQPVRQSASPMLGLAPMPRRLQVPMAFASSAGGVANAASDEPTPFVNPAVWGRTYRQTGPYEYTWDSTRTDGPARGVRILLATLGAEDGVGQAIVGTVDVLDSTTSTTQVGRLLIRNAQGSLLGSFRMTEAVTGDPEVTGSMAYTFTGSLGAPATAITIADTVSGTMTSGAMTMTASMRGSAPFAGVQYTMAMTVKPSSSETDMRVTLAGRTFRYHTAHTSTTRTFRIYLDETVVAAQDNDGPLTFPSGVAPAQELQAFLERLEMVMATMPSGSRLADGMRGLAGAFDWV